jgi:hypothetical protein
MMKAIVLALAAAAGSALGLLAFFVIEFFFLPTHAVDELKVWMEHDVLISGGVGAVCGVIMGWAVCLGIIKRRIQVSVTREIPSAETAVAPRKNSRPLTWLYRS